MPAFSPPDYIHHDWPGPDQIVFLAGPIQGAADWQAEAIAMLKDRDRDLKIANPRSNMWSPALPENTRRELYKNQLEWEHHHLDWAIRKGCVLFWLEKESSHIRGRAFAQTSRLELGLIHGWMTGIKRFTDSTPFGNPLVGNNVQLVVGAHSEFSGRNYVKYLCSKYNLPLYDTLRDTCEAAIRVLSLRRK